MGKSALEAAFLMQVRAVKLPEPEQEFRFHSKRKWRADFAWKEQRILVEIEGGVWSGGRHTRGSGFIGDCDKYNTATLEGWRVFRFAGDHVKNGTALNTIERAIFGGIK
ncbi:hypothetical protein [Endozoicomonas sp. GU-1]|uniref:hypothetical protein n=1 Tax=Endozoicomonas sp. GU-1 TaxID=3009078 RepID=UPI0022B2C6BA|nr:hypothetical protein [Endozoicomonas sp. GU-1]WBA79572.1 hypothetical protein O2T12_14405 [Endozoicomonas sp. GU-1]